MYDRTIDVSCIDMEILLEFYQTTWIKNMQNDGCLIEREDIDESVCKKKKVILIFINFYIFRKL